MKKSENSPSIAPSTLKQASHLFAAHQQTIYKSTDRMFAVLMSIQWIAGVIAALWIAPRTWIGTTSQTHIHVWAAIFLGGAISFFPIILAVTKPGENATRYVIATSQMLMSALLIYLTGGRIETHFHVFGSLAFLAFYRDWRVLVPATIVVAADHFLRGVFWPQSVYGVLSASEWRWLEHAGWVLFEDTFLFIAIKRSVGEMWSMAQRTAELNDNEERYRAVVEQTAEGLVLADVDTKRVLECNVAFADLLGYTLEEALTLTAYDFVVDEREAIDRRSGTLLDRKLPITGERRFRRKDDSIIDVEVNVSVIFYGGKDVFCTVVRDISERKRAEEALRESELRFRSVTQSANDSIVSADSKGNIVFWNKGAESAFGYTEEEILGKPLTQLMPEEYRAAHKAGMKRFLATREAHVIGKTVELSGLRKDGTVFPFELSLATWHTKQGTFFTGIFRDISERIEASEALREAHDELEMKVQERTTELAQLNDVLKANNLERKRAEEALKESKEWLTAIFDSSRDGIIAEENERIVYVNHSYAHLFGIGEDIDLRIELGASLGRIGADPGQVEQILLNLAISARDAIPDGGYLTIKTENVYFDGKFSQRRSVVEPGHYVMLSVSDNGCGMDTETQTHIFEPFYTTKEVGKGTGLGLSTVYGIVKQSGGSIWVYSEVGRGTTFKIYLPRVDEVVETEESADKSRSVPRGTETILLVEDEEMVRDLSKEILEQYGYAVITAPNGKEGLRICKEFEGDIDLMITDVVMPHMSGRQLAESIGALRPDTRVLYMSGFTDDAVVRHGVLADGVCFIQKPFSPDSLAAKAREVLDQVEAR